MKARELLVKLASAAKADLWPAFLPGLKSRIPPKEANRASGSRFSQWAYILGLLFSIGLIVWLLSIAGQELELSHSNLDSARSLGSNLGLFLFINSTIIAIIVLFFLVGRHLVKLALDRRRNILGSKLRLKLVAAFVALSLVPTVLLFLVAKVILGSVLAGWFSPQISEAVDAGVNIARIHYDSQESSLRRDITHISKKLVQLFPYLENTETGSSDFQGEVKKTVLSHYLQEQVEEFGMKELAIVDGKGRVLVSVARPVTSLGFISPPPYLNEARVKQALHGALVVITELSFTDEYLRAYSPLNQVPLSSLIEETDLLPSDLTSQKQGPSLATYALVGTVHISPRLSREYARVIDAHDDYRELKTYERPLASSYLLTLAIVTLMVVFAAMWFGFHLARSLTGPIKLLAEGTQQIAHGNLSHRIPELGDDELSLLVRSFNVMTTDLQTATQELVSRRRYIETILDTIGVGVISLDETRRVETCNRRASSMLSMPQLATGLLISDCLSPDLSQVIISMLESWGSVTTTSLTTSAVIAGEPRHFHITATRMLDASEVDQGVVLLIDDMTDLVSAQRMAAWRDVARRIAHEIKNPLTPIQLSAQRIERRLLKSGAESSEDNPVIDTQERDIFLQATQTITKQVQVLRTLVNEFSRFARMPRAHPKPEQLNELVREQVVIYRDSHPHITLSFSETPNLPLLSLDRVQIGQVLTNLFDNARHSIEIAAEIGEASKDEISISTSHHAELGFVVLTISDTGLGITDTDKPKLFEPYFSRKEGGTGLGLAIVSTIVADHHGFIRVRDNKPQGATFVIEIPVARKDMQEAPA